MFAIRGGCRCGGVPGVVIECLLLRSNDMSDGTGALAVKSVLCVKHKVQLLWYTVSEVH